MQIDPAPFTWNILGPSNVVYTEAELAQIKAAVQEFRRALPHHQLLAANVKVAEGDGVFGQRRWSYMSAPNEEEK